MKLILTPDFRIENVIVSLSQKDLVDGPLPEVVILWYNLPYYKIFHIFVWIIVIVMKYCHVMTMLYQRKKPHALIFCAKSCFRTVWQFCDIVTWLCQRLSFGALTKKLNTCQTQFYTNSSGTDRLMKALKKNQHFVLAQKNSTAIAMRSFACWYDIFEQQLSSLYTTAFKVLQKVVYA